MDNITALAAKLCVFQDCAGNAQDIVQGLAVNTHTKNEVLQSLTKRVHDGEIAVSVLDDKGWLVNTTVVAMKLKPENGEAYIGLLIHRRLRFWYFDELEFWTTLNIEDIMAVRKRYFALSGKHGIILHPTSDRDLCLLTAFLSEVDQDISASRHAINAFK